MEALFRKGSLTTERHIVKGSSDRLPYLALNEHLSMRAAARTGAKVARTAVSDDGHVLVVERFDVEPDGSRLGFEDCCSLLGLPPADKYASTWERVVRRITDFTAPVNLGSAREQLALTLLLTYALGNADCHTKTSRCFTRVSLTYAWPRSTTCSRSSPTMPTRRTRQACS